MSRASMAKRRLLRRVQFTPAPGRGRAVVGGWSPRPEAAGQARALRLWVGRAVGVPSARRAVRRCIVMVLTVGASGASRRGRNDAVLWSNGKVAGIATLGGTGRVAAGSNNVG